MKNYITGTPIHGPTPKEKENLNKKRGLNMLIISAFPATGKSYIVNNNIFPEFIIKDSDSSKYSFIGEYGNKPNPEFPNNYIQHILQDNKDTDILFISTHDIVRKELFNRNIPYILVYPENTYNNKLTYQKRFKNRNSPKKFIQKMFENWDKYIQTCKDDPIPYKIKLKPNMYLQDIIRPILYSKQLIRKEE